MILWRYVIVTDGSISMSENETAIESVQRWLREARSDSARLLSERPVIVIWPTADCDQIIWPA